jgi:hypothetical protein
MPYFEAERFKLIKLSEKPTQLSLRFDHPQTTKRTFHTL